MCFKIVVNPHEYMTVNGNVGGNWDWDACMTRAQIIVLIFEV